MPLTPEQRHRLVLLLHRDDLLYAAYTRSFGDGRSSTDLLLDCIEALVAARKETQDRFRDFIAHSPHPSALIQRN